MRIKARVKPGAKKDRIDELPDGSYAVEVRAQPRAGKANQAVEGILADHFKVPGRNVKVVGGFRSRCKIIEIKNE